jgi:hypothetical protein
MLARKALPSGNPRLGGTKTVPLEVSVTAASAATYSITVDKLAQRLVITYLIWGQR